MQHRDEQRCKESSGALSRPLDPIDDLTDLLGVLATVARKWNVDDVLNNSTSSSGESFSAPQHVLHLHSLDNVDGHD